MISANYSSTAPTGWNMLPPEAKQKFYDIGSKGDWSAHEAYDHLVPDSLKDNPEEVVTWMDGGEVTTTEWVYDRGYAGGHYEQVTHEIPDRDVSRMESGVNGGEYSTDNTVMEDMSTNRARGGDNMVESELQSVNEQNLADIELIETLPGDITTEGLTAVESTFVPVETGSGLFEFLGDVVLPITAATYVGTKVAKTQSTPQDSWGWGMLSAGLTAVVMASPAGPPIATGYFVGSLGIKLYRVFAPIKAKLAN